MPLHLNEPQIAADLLIMLMQHMSQEYFATPWSGALESQLWEAAMDSMTCSSSRRTGPLSLGKMPGLGHLGCRRKSAEVCLTAGVEGMYGERLIHRIEEQQS